MTAAINAGMAAVTAATGPLSATPDKLAVSASYACFGTTTSCTTAVNMSTDTVTVSSTGGTGAGPTYAWTRVSGDVFTISAAAAAATYFSASVNRDSVKSAVYRCTVTRGVGTYQVDVPVTGTYTYESDNGPPGSEEP
jgi:hypothetical protein